MPLNNEQTVLSRLVKAILNAAAYNPEVQAAPACILWPDKDRQWEAVISRLQKELPQLYVLGDYSPENRTGPAIWLRCVLAGTVSPEPEDQSESKVGDVPPKYSVPENIPIFYLPGVSRQDLRAIESCPEYLKPLAELQYRGTLWSQINAKDWTIFAFLKSDQGGLGLDVAQDSATRNAMQLALYLLMDEDIDLLKGKHLDKDFFNTLLTGGDPVRDLLVWLDQGDTFRESRGENEWKAFVEVCKSQLAFDPENDGVLVGSSRLAERKGPWQPVWERFCEAPKRYPNIPLHIRKCKMPEVTLVSDVTTHGGWPQWNEEQEGTLRQDLQELGKLAPHICRKRIIDVNKMHRDRRSLVWAELGEAPLACAMEHLAILAEITGEALNAGTIDDITTGYRSWGWRADDAVLRALSCVDKHADWKAVAGAIRTMYLPWIEDSARYLQGLVEKAGYPGETASTHKARYKVHGECILFVDGLRFDIARRLAEILELKDCVVEETICWAALPTVTATGKPAVTPVRDKIHGEEATAAFEPGVAETGQSLKGGNALKKLLSAAGWEILGKSESGDSTASAWCEFGDIDHEGHDRGWKLARHVDVLLGEICDRIEQLLDAGWKTVRVVTDHGWLLMPGGLPKTDLPASLVESKWGRCAAIKSGAVTEETLFPWYWNPSHYFALATGISCYRSGEEYSHGGLSLQECLTLELTVSSGTGKHAVPSVEITDIAWKGLRCTVAVEGEFSGLSLDIRTQPGNASSSVIVSSKALKENGTASVVVENEELEGTLAALVLIDDKGNLVAQVETEIGGGST